MLNGKVRVVLIPTGSCLTKSTQTDQTAYKHKLSQPRTLSQECNALTAV